MTDKCNKYEALFTFQSEEKLKEHILTCEECRKEYEQMKKVSDLIQEVKPYFKKKQSSHKVLKTACVLLFFLVSGITFSMNTDFTDTLKYGTTLSAEDLGFPVDDYGLITVVD